MEADMCCKRLEDISVGDVLRALEAILSQWTAQSWNQMEDAVFGQLRDKNMLEENNDSNQTVDEIKLDQLVKTENCRNWLQFI